MQDQVEHTIVNSSRRVEAAEDVSVYHLLNASPARANGTNSTSDDLVDCKSIWGFITSWSDHHHTIGSSELLGHGII